MASRTIPRMSNEESNGPHSLQDLKPFVGMVENTIEAMRLIYAASKGVVPRTTKRLTTSSERREKIQSGAIFIFSAEESGIRRWTDGRQWSASRAAGNFLIYRELAEKKSEVKDFDWFEELISADGKVLVHSEGANRDAPLRRKTAAPTSKDSVQVLKEGGLSKRTITVKIDDVDFHLVCYHTQHDIDNRILSRLSSRADITAITLVPEAFKFDDFRFPPKVIVDADGRSPRIICQLDPVDFVDNSDVGGNTQDTQSSNRHARIIDAEASVADWKASTGSELQEGYGSGPGISSGNTWDYGQHTTQIMPTLRPPDHYSSDVGWNSSMSSSASPYQHPIDRCARLAASSSTQFKDSSGHEDLGDGREGDWYAQRDMQSDWHERLRQMEVVAYRGMIQETTQQFGWENLLRHDVPHDGQFEYDSPPTTIHFPSPQKAQFYQEYPETSRSSNPEFQDANDDQQHQGYESR